MTRKQNESHTFNRLSNVSPLVLRILPSFLPGFVFATAISIMRFDGIEGEPTGHIPPINDILEICKKWWSENL